MGANGPECPVQGGAADIFKLAMVNLDAELEERAMRSRMVLTVHDEVVLEVPPTSRAHRGGAPGDGSVWASTSPSRWRSHGSTWADAKQ